MKRFLFGIIIGILALAAFLYFGGPGYLKTFGAKTEEAGEKLEKYEKGFKKSADEAAETVKEKAGEAKESVGKTVEKTKKAVDKTTEKVKEYAR